MVKCLLCMPTGHLEKNYASDYAIVGGNPAKILKYRNK